MRASTPTPRIRPARTAWRRLNWYQRRRSLCFFSGVRSFGVAVLFGSSTLITNRHQSLRDRSNSRGRGRNLKELLHAEAGQGPEPMVQDVAGEFRNAQVCRSLLSNCGKAWSLSDAGSPSGTLPTTESSKPSSAATLGGWLESSNILR